MDITITARELQKALKTVAPAVPKRSNLPILSNVKLWIFTGDGSTNILGLAGYNLETGILTAAPIQDIGPDEIPADSHSAQIDGICLPLDKLTEAVKGVPGSTEIRLTATMTETPESVVDREATPDKEPRFYFVAALNFAGRTVTIKGSDPADFPNIPMPTTPLAVLTSDFPVAYMKVGQALANDQSRPVLSGLHIQLGLLHASLTAADGFRLHTTTTPCSVAMNRQGEPPSVIIPGPAVTAALKALAWHEYVEVAAMWTEGATPTITNVAFSEGDTIVVSRVIDGQYPDYERIIPARDAWVTAVTVDRDVLVPAVKAALANAKTNSSIVRLVFGRFPTLCTIMSKSEDGDEYEDTIGCTIEGEPHTVAFNGRYVIDALKALPRQVMIGIPADVAKPKREYRNGEYVDTGEFEAPMPGGPVTFVAADPNESDLRVVIMQMHTDR